MKRALLTVGLGVALGVAVTRWWRQPTSTTSSTKAETK
jgi:hypothetical protein